MKRSRLPLLAMILCAWMGSAIRCQAQIQVPPDLKPLWPAESQVYEQVAVGKEAVLEGKDQKKLIVRGRFLEALLTNELKGLEIPPRSGVKIRNAIIIGPVKLEYAEVPDIVELKDCHFGGKVELKNCQFQKELILSGSHFYHDLTCQSKFATDAYFDKVQVDGKTWFAGASITSELSANNAEFRGSAGFPGIYIGRSAYFQKAKFLQEVSFYRGDIREDLNLDGARFEGEALFAGLKVGMEFRADEVEFLKKVDFKRIEVAQNARFNGSVFSGPVCFSKAHIGEAELKLTEQKEPGVSFKNVEFKDEVLIDGAHFSNLIIKGAPNIRYLNLEQTLVDQKLTFEDLTITKFIATNLEENGVTIFNKVKFMEEANFTESHFQTLKLEGNKWPLNEGVILNGMVYQAISPWIESVPRCISREDYKKQCKEESVPKCISLEDYNKQWEKEIVNWIQESRFDTSNYKLLEAYCARSGYEDLADTVYIDMKDREFKYREGWLSWLGTNIWYYTAGYGRKPSWIVYWSLGFLILGGLLFKPRYIEACGNLPEGRFCKGLIPRILLSLDQFLPGISLGIAKDWKYKEMGPWICFYSGLHRLLGYILISIALATLIAGFK